MVSQVEEFNDKKTEGGDPSGDVFLFHMGTPEFERLKSYTELQRAVPTYSPPAAVPPFEGRNFKDFHLLRTSVPPLVFLLLRTSGGTGF